MGTTPGVGKRGLVDVELGLAETAGADGSAGVRDLLEDGLRAREAVDQPAKCRVLSGSELVDECLEDKGRVAGPGVQVVRVRRARASNDDAGLSERLAC